MQEEPSIVIRDMKPGEEPALVSAARRAFVHSPMEQIAISKPKTALVAEVDGAVAGAMFLRVFGAGEKKTGYLDVGFVAREYRGLGVGRVLYPAATDRLREMGCEPVTAMVIDDNVASWESLENQGFGTPSLTELVRLLGFGRAVSLWLQTLLCLACGARLWVDAPVKKRGSFQELAAFLLVNLLLFLPGRLFSAAGPAQLVQTLLAFSCVLLTGVFFGSLGCLAGGGAWQFSFPRRALAYSLQIYADMVQRGVGKDVNFYYWHLYCQDYCFPGSGKNSCSLDSAASCFNLNLETSCRKILACADISSAVADDCSAVVDVECITAEI